MRIGFYIFVLALSFSALPLAAQVSSVEFGKNRVQYHQDFADWAVYESPNFITYWYGEGRYIGQATVQLAEYDFAYIENLLEHRLNDKIEIIVYTDVTDLKQSNIGNEETFVNIGGQTKIVGNKMFVYFNGDHNNLRIQIREGIATVYMNAMLFGSNLQEIVQNAVLMNLPNWFKEGLIAFAGEEWNTTLDNQLRDIIRSGQYANFTEFAEEQPRLAGHSIWYFISQNYGKSTVSNLLYLTRINRSIESGFLYVLGSTYERTTNSWYSYFEDRYDSESANLEEPPGERVEFKNRRNLPVTQALLSPDGKRVAYVLNEIGKVKVYVQDIETGERKVIQREGFRNPFQATDYNYPLIAWSPGGLELCIIYERRDVIKILKYNIYNGDELEEDIPTAIQRIYSIDYVNPYDMVLSAGIDGQSDLFLYFSKTRQFQRITNDFWDDLDARYVKLGDQQGIIFASNRQDTIIAPRLALDTTLPVNTFDLFYYDLETRNTELIRLTHTPFANERQPISIDSAYFGYVSDQTGIYNRYQGYLEDYIHHYDKIVRFEDDTEVIMHPDSSLATKFDSLELQQIDTVFIQPVIKKRAVNSARTNYNRSILAQNYAPQANRMLELLLRDGEYQISVLPFEHEAPAVSTAYSIFRLKQLEFYTRFIAPPVTPKETEPAPSEQTTILEPKEEKPIDTATIPEEKKVEKKLDIDTYTFQSEFDEEEEPPAVVVDEDKGQVSLKRPEPEPKLTPTPRFNPVATREVLKFEPSKIVSYRTKFRTDFVTTQLDNSLLFDGLNSYAGTPQDFGFPPPGILIKANFKDLFEDYELEGGIRIPTTFNGAEYFLVFDDKKKQLDKRYALYRRALRFADDGSLTSPIQPRIETTTFLGQYQVRYPFDIYTSLRGMATLRFDNTTQLATDVQTLQTPSIREQRAGLRAEYVFDNTLDVALNIKNGTRYKVYAEAVKRFNVSVVDRFQFDFRDGFMGIVGFDARHYQRILKHSVLALRAAGATSFGSERILYYLGGTDNWLFPRFNEEIPLPDADANFAYQTVAANLRGFRLNIRNGSSFALANTELRVPVFRHLSRNLKSNFLRNFQMVGFFDIGTAWQGRTPFADENPLNTKTIPDPEVPSNPVVVKVRFFRDPIVIGYGVGARMLLFGYFLRLDYAWGVETRVVQEPRLYISLGMDF